jgi:L-threonylcarbamoyladenylate synthase
MRATLPSAATGGLVWRQGAVLTVGLGLLRLFSGRGLWLGPARPVMDTSSPVEVLPTHTAELFARAVARAAACLKAGEPVGLPTETVYGLAAAGFDPEAVRRVYSIKGRPPTNPVILHVASLEMARSCAREWPPEADRLAKAFWPGPLTVIVPRAERVPDVVTAGGDTVGVRWPSHPLAQAVIRACGFPLAAPSANRANEVSPTTARHVLASLGDRVPLIIDGGASHVGIESTVVDVTTRPARILRPGMIHEESLMAVLGRVERVEATGTAESGPMRSPGQFLRHYAPRARLRVMRWRDEEDLRAQLITAGCDLATTQILAHDRTPTGFPASQVSVIPQDAEAYARALYAEWRRCDEAGASCIVMEAVPEGAA